MDDFVKWKPEFDGEKPPYWQDGMVWNLWPSKPTIPLSAEWTDNNLYSVPREAVYGPAEKLLSWTEATAAVAKRTLSSAPLSDLKQALSKHSAEELAEHGITLAPELDWATELWADLLDARGFGVSASNVRNDELEEHDRAAIELLCSRVVPKEASDA